MAFIGGNNGAIVTPSYTEDKNIISGFSRPQGEWGDTDVVRVRIFFSGHNLDFFQVCGRCFGMGRRGTGNLAHQLWVR